MKRPKQHVTDARGITQVRTAFESLGWTVEPIENDYGLDLNVEVFSREETTGVIFRVQVKSSDSTKYSEDGSFISEPISRDNAEYWCVQLRSPVVLIHADIASGKTFWAIPYLDTALVNSLENKATDRISVRIPTANLLPTTSPRLIEAIAQAESVFATRLISARAVPDFLGDIKGRIDKDKVRQELRDKSDALGIQQAEDLIKSGSLDDVIGRVNETISDGKASVANRFWAFLVLERAEAIKASTVGRGADHPRIQLSVCMGLRQVAKHGPHHLKFYSLIAKLGSQLHVLTSKAFTLYINAKIYKSSTTGEPFWQAILEIERARLTQRIVQKFDQCVRVVGYAVNSPSLGALPHAMLRIVRGITPFIHQTLEENPEAAEPYIRTSFAICRLAAEVALASGDEGTAGWAACHCAMLVPGGTAEIAAWAASIIAQIKDESGRAFFESTLSETLEIRARANAPLTIKQEQEIFRQMAEAQGIDLDQSNDSIAQIINIGIRDFDPTRVLKNCQHFFIAAETVGLPGQCLGLQTAGAKRLHCTLKGVAISGISLDLIHTAFKSTYCDACQSCSPHAPEWAYTHEWQRHQNELHEDLLDFPEDGPVSKK